MTVMTVMIATSVMFINNNSVANVNINCNPVDKTLNT